MKQRFAGLGRLLAPAGCLITVAMLVGCSPSSDLTQVQNNQFEMRGMVANDRQQIESLREQVSRLNDRLSEIEHNGTGGQGENGSAVLEQRVSKLEQQVATTQPGNTGANGAGAGATEGGVPGPGEAGGEETASAIPPPTPNAPPEGGAASWRGALDHELAAPHNDPGAKLYRAGLADMKAGRYAQAVAKFQDLQRRYPKSELSEAAEYFSANGLYESGKYDQSILQFNDLTMRFPRGRFATAALLREAQAFIKINDRIDARLTLQKLLNDHPEAPEAPSAKSMMQTLMS
jgi:tol-pal system protein YbgF